MTFANRHRPAAQATTQRWHTLISAALAAVVVCVSAMIASLAFAAPATAAAPTYVGIVIAGDKSACVAWKPGMTGDSLLREVAKVSYQKQTGFIDQIDGKPADASSSISRYWSYWHRTTGAWAYSQKAASNYSVPPGSVEGWIFGNGAAPPSGSFSTICAAATASPTASASLTHAAAAAAAPSQDASSHSSAGRVAGISIAVLAVAALGGAAFWQQRRRRS